MTYFTEIDWTKHQGGRISKVVQGGLASEIGLISGDILLAVNGNKVDDVIDVQYYAADENIEFLVRRNEEFLLYESIREYNQSLGIEFEHATFDTDIRRCNNLCEFCFVLQMAPKFRRTLYIKDDDYRYSFLFGHFVTLTNLDEHDWWKIQEMALSPLYISVHVTDIEKRRQFLRNPGAPDILTQIKLLTENGIQLHTQLVIVPDFNDGPWLEQSIRDLAEFYPSVQSISVVPVGLTSHHKYNMRTHTPEEAKNMLDYLSSLQQDFKKSLKIRFVYPTDEWYLVANRPVPATSSYDGHNLQENGLGMVRDFLNEWESLSKEIQAWMRNRRHLSLEKPNQISLVTGTLFAETLKKIAREFQEQTGILTEVKPIVNIRLGELITVAGLLMGVDVLNQLKSSALGNLVVLPRVMFDHPDTVSLDDLTPQELADELNVQIVLADSMGDVWDAVVGESSTIYDPGL